jgi:2-polyprenyl-3-methyl-5-hydroxy-6-metoxy-1,4-benzoquinol methylase
MIEVPSPPARSILASIYNRGARLTEDQTVPAESACPLCGFSGHRPAAITLQDAPPVYLLACRCGCLSASRMPREDVLREYYSRYYAAIDGTATFDGDDRFARHLFRTLGIAPKPRMRILDFGGGMDAVLARSLARQFVQRGTRGVEIALVDYNACCKRDWADRITVDCYRGLAEVAEGFDAVIASAVLEHIPYPREIIMGLLKSLGKGGRAYFRTPVMSPIVKWAGRVGLAVDFTYPAHVHDMGQAFWENLLTALDVDGFRLVRSRPSIVETDFKTHPSRTAIAHLFKLPWLVLRQRYPMVGGWEAVFARGGVTVRP